MAQEIDINLNVNTEQADKSFGSLKSQLRQAQQEVAALSDKFGATSKEAVEAAKRAGELKDRIGDAKALTEAFNPDAKFKALSASLSGVANGFAAYQGALGLAGVESKDLEKQLLKVQSAMAIAAGLQGLGEARDSFKQLKAVAIDAFNGIKTAIGSTGIGLLVVAAGAIYAYWDDIKEAVSGVSEEQKKLNAVSQKNVDQQNEKLKSIGSQDNILKLQGKTEKEILDIKIKQTDESIAANKINQENQKTNTKLAVEGAERNLDMLKSYLEFVSMPIRFLYENGAKAINGIIDLINKVPGVEIKYKVDEKFGDQAVDYLAKLAFDPDKVKKEGDEAVKASQDAINKLLNDRAGYQLGKNAIDKKAELSEEEKLKKLKENTKKYNEELSGEQASFDVSSLEQLDATNQAKLDADQALKDKLVQNQLTYAQLLYDSETEIEAREEEQRQRKLESFQATTDAISSIAKSGSDLLFALQENGLAKSKAGQAVMKAVTLAQIAADSASAFSKMMQGTEIAASGAATSVPPPAAPATYLATKIAFYASGSATILSNIARAKALLSGGGGGGGGASVGGGGGSVAAAPSFNIVGQGGANQIAQSIGGQMQQPLQAFVVGQDVTTQQGLNRGIVQNATLG
jgi:hypothetical protein